ncbi:hypothetical protein ACFVAD_23585 [Sutcliffiella sp. NPDC057660]|uniref:hypothetical protein n=1 Tax=Sutcliffiella sp. NPDC057660 TaxID=3346199 RepID=UPI0036760C37
MKIIKIITIFYVLFSVTACTQELNSEQMIANNEIKKDPDVDLFLLNYSVYKKVTYLNEDDVELNNFSSIGEIKDIYSGEGYLKENMSTKLPVKTEIFRSDDESGVIIAKTIEGYILYESIPEG